MQPEGSPWVRRPLRAAPRAFLFFGAFGRGAELLDVVKERIVARFGPLHGRGESALFPFPDTQTYAASMGTSLVRRFWVLAQKWPQDGLASVKKDAIELEDEIRRCVKTPVARPVNIDPGLINDCRVILASTKDYAHRLYRGDGIWEEITLVYTRGAYHELPWTYPDFKNPDYHRFFEGFRDELLGR